jgi:hypothetical protein
MLLNKGNVTDIKLRVASKGYVKLDICRCKNCRTVF